MDLRNEILCKNFDLNRYMGNWYEIARLPTPFQTQCSRSLATYEPIPLPSGTSATLFSVFNTCFSKDEKIMDFIRGFGRVSDPRYPAALTIHFPGVPKERTELPNYLVHYTDYDNIAIVGSLNRERLHLLCRKPETIPILLYIFAEIADNLGYDVSKLQINKNTIHEEKY